jgi:hypothetical protein
MQVIEHNEVFDLAYRFVSETNENIFLTGKAGTGKTTFLRYLKESAAKNIIVAAPTGVAAINAGGVTLHSLFQLPFHPFLPTKNNKAELVARLRFNKQRKQILRKMDLLVIDEISMVRCDVMDAIDTVLKFVRRNHHLPFGGVQVLCIGDLYQLPPVAQNQEWKILGEYYRSPFFFDSLAVKELSPVLIELNKIYRQKESGFVELLNKVRNNTMVAEDFDLLHSRFNPLFQPGVAENFITLTSHNNQADLINQQRLHKLPGPDFTFTAEISGDFPESMYPAEFELKLKKGAQVMFLKNDLVQKRYFNGKIGIITALEKDKITVCCDDTDIDVRPEEWINSRYALNRADGKLEQETLGTFTQYPLRLAWAITIHKSQGLTFEKVMIDAAGAFSSGQVYVALSRCTSLDGIVLLSKIPLSAISNNDKVRQGEQSMVHRGLLPERFFLARKLFTQQLLEEIFSFGGLAAKSSQLTAIISEHKTRLNEKALAWVDTFTALIDAEKMVGVKFMRLIETLIKNSDTIENNPVLLKRISDAANHFTPRLENLLANIKAHPVTTEHKDVSVSINEQLNDLAINIHTSLYNMQFCTGSFSVLGYLQHKLKMALPRFNISCYASEKDVEHEGTPNAELLATLKRWRNMICEELGFPIYMVANLASLAEISIYLPLTKKDLMLIAGFGKAKADKYGEDILDMVRAFCERNNLESNIGAKKESPKRERLTRPRVVKTDTKMITIELFRQGKDVASIAAERNLSVATIQSHLAHFIGLGELDINIFVDSEKQGLINAAIIRHGTASHKTLIENLPAGIGYGEVKMVIAASNQKLIHLPKSS